MKQKALWQVGLINFPCKSGVLVFSLLIGNPEWYKTWVTPILRLSGDFKQKFHLHMTLAVL